MVILHVVAPGAFGGLERVVQGLVRGLHGLGHDVHVTAVATEPGTDPHAFLAPLSDVGVHTALWVAPGRTYLRERSAIAQVCRQVRPDVVHTHGYRPDVVDSGVARRLRIPVVTTVHGSTGGGWRNRLYQWLQCRAFRRFDAVVAVSRPLVARLERAGVPPSRIHEVPNAWCELAPVLERAVPPRVLGISQDGFAVGWAAGAGPGAPRVARRRGGVVPRAVGAGPQAGGCRSWGVVRGGAGRPLCGRAGGVVGAGVAWRLTPGGGSPAVLGGGRRCARGPRR